MFVILPDEVMNEWAEWLAKKSFDLTATGIFSVELPAKQLGLIQACTPRSTINRLYSLRNGFWLSESPWAYVGTMHDDWPRMILTAMRQLVMENDPAAAFKTARAAQKASLCTRTFPEMTANWFYGQILYAGAGAVFKNEADGETVAQVFGALEAEAGTGEVARSHFQAVAAALGDVLVGEAGVDGAVDLDACSGTGACGEERRKGSGRFSKLHDVVFDEVC